MNCLDLSLKGVCLPGIQMNNKLQISLLKLVWKDFLSTCSTLTLTLPLSFHSLRFLTFLLL